MHFLLSGISPSQLPLLQQEILLRAALIGVKKQARPRTLSCRTMPVQKASERQRTSGSTLPDHVPFARSDAARMTTEEEESEYVGRDRP